MARRIEEFYCDVAGGGCGKYFCTYLRENMFGNYSIVCPACGHTHFRVIKQGLVTSDRHDQRMGQTEIIHCLLSTVRDTPWTNDADFRRRQLIAYNGGASDAAHRQN